MKKESWLGIVWLVVVISAWAEKAANLRRDAGEVENTGWKQSPWFGNFYDSSSNWIHHESLGWLYPVDSGEDASWLYHPKLKWMWTRTTNDFYPWLYLNQVSAWRYYSDTSGFYDPATYKRTKQADLATLVGTANANPGPYSYSKFSEGNGIRNGPGYKGATVYYPTTAEPPFAGIAIVPGYLSTEDTIRAWGPFYASHGIVAITIGTNSLGDLPELRSAALLDAVVSLQGENNRSDSPLHGSLDINRFAVSGWSMGGGGAQMAAINDPTLLAVVALCPWPPYATFNHQVPTLIFTGQLDPITPPGINGLHHYLNTPDTTPKLYYEVKGQRHWAANDPKEGNGEVGRYALVWLKTFLEGDERYRQFIAATPNAASRFETNLK